MEMERGFRDQTNPTKRHILSAISALNIESKMSLQLLNSSTRNILFVAVVNRARQHGALSQSAIFVSLKAVLIYPEYMEN